MLSDLVLSEITAGHGITLKEAAKLVPPARKGRPVTLSCLLRWVLDGVRVPDGHRVRLEAARLAGRWITSAGALRRFVAAQTPPPSEPLAGVPRSPGKRLRANERAAEELDHLGI